MFDSIYRGVTSDLIYRPEGNLERQEHSGSFLFSAQQEISLTFSTHKKQTANSDLLIMKTNLSFRKKVVDMNSNDRVSTLHKDDSGLLS
jgi:hypothetical protein